MGRETPAKDRAADATLAAAMDRRAGVNAVARINRLLALTLYC
jgi:hypothetical protein